MGPPACKMLPTRFSHPWGIFFSILQLRNLRLSNFKLFQGHFFAVRFHSSRNKQNLDIDKDNAHLYTVTRVHLPHVVVVLCTLLYITLQITVVNYLYFKPRSKCRSSSTQPMVNDNPLQYSWLENPMEKGAWWAEVHGIAKTWLKRLSMHTSNKFDLWMCTPNKAHWYLGDFLYINSSAGWAGVPWVTFTQPLLALGCGGFSMSTSKEIRTINLVVKGGQRLVSNYN